MLHSFVIPAYAIADQSAVVHLNLILEKGFRAKSKLFSHFE